MKNGPNKAFFVIFFYVKTEIQDITHHLCVVWVEGLFIQGELLRTEGMVEFNHLRKLQGEINNSQSSLNGGQNGLEATTV